jgi:choline dehydrogenase
VACTPSYSNEADHVAVGSGSSGATIAGRLAPSGASVIVLEAGKSDEQYLVRKPGMIGPMHSVSQIKARVDWGLYSSPQEHLSAMPSITGGNTHAPAIMIGERGADLVLQEEGMA